MPVEVRQCQIALEEGLQALQVSAHPSQIEKCIAFLDLLHKWNQRMNLTSVRSPLAMITRHFLDSMAISPHLEGNHIIDVGTGAGFPGIPLSIFHPEKNFVLLDSLQKKQLFVTQAIKLLDLNNAKGACSLVQNYEAPQKFHAILTRAFAPMEKMLSLTTHLLNDEGRFLAMLGKVTQECLRLPPYYELERIVQLQVPGEKGQRHLAIVKKALTENANRKTSIS